MAAKKMIAKPCTIFDRMSAKEAPSRMGMIIHNRPKQISPPEVIAPMTYNIFENVSVVLGIFQPVAGRDGAAVRVALPPPALQNQVFTIAGGAAANKPPGRREEGER
mmetsp:Transcript_78764/g.204662  ORF Transcript_78764/g.204662 Transcript_78764/m.204662 type:complete len:107 (+) Transcript_78764:340-660(+)